jgi:hypothetical protein
MKTLFVFMLAVICREGLFAGGTDSIPLDSRILQPGHYTVQWDGCDGAGRSAGNGTYIIKINNGAFTKITKAVLFNTNGR